MLEKELLKDVNDLDHLVLTFEDVEKKVVVFPRSLKGRWDKLIIENNYLIKIFKKESENPNNKFILLDFKKKSKIINEKEAKFKEEINKFFITESKLLKKEKLKNSEDKDYLVLNFKNVKGNIIIHPNRMKNRWDEMIVNETYKLGIVRRNQTGKKIFYLVLKI